MKPLLFLPLLGLLLSVNAAAETVKGREGAVRGDKAKLEQDPRWNYNDLESGFSLAKLTGKPLLAVLRCVPCLSCAGIDAKVLEEKELAPLLDQFVCVRVINANALDLSKFQFDYDPSFSAMMFRGDGTVYGRFGSWQHQRDPMDKTTAGFKKALEGALALHQDYPANKKNLAGKQGGATPYQRPVEFPALSAKYGSKLDWDGKVVQSCVHCHMVGDAFRAHYRSRKEPVPPEWIYPQPSIQVLGADLANDEPAKIETGDPGSPAAAAGLLAGDELISLNGQTLVSTADVSWALHRSPEAGGIPMTLRRSGMEMPITLSLPAGWRSRSDISKRAGTWPMRAMAFGGMSMEDLDDDERSRQDLPLESLALRIKHVGQYGPHAAAKKAGFLTGDLIVQIAQLKLRLTESALIGHLLQHHFPSEKLTTEVFRNGKRLSLLLPQQ